MAAPNLRVRKPGRDPDTEAAVDEAHFRIDEHDRRLDALEAATTPDHTAAVAHGAVATLHAGLEKRLQEQLAGVTERLVRAVREDVESDRAIVKALGELVEQLRHPPVVAPATSETSRLEQLAGKLDELVLALRAPVTRTASIDLPSGKANVTVRESRG